MTIVVYTKPNDAPSESIRRDLSTYGVEVNERDIFANPEHFEEMKALGYLQAPVTVVDASTHWAGYFPHKIMEHIAS